MTYLIFDMEWNQPSSRQERNPALIHGEIIQLGFLIVSEGMDIIRKERLTIKPVCYPTMNKYVSLLTGITQEEADSGLSFREAIASMSRHFSDDTVLFTWGDDDMPILRENMAFHGIDIPLPRHYNLQRIFCAQTNTPQRQIALKTAAEQLGANSDIQAHDALNDAYVTFLIAKKLNLSDGIAQYGSFTFKTASKQAHWAACQPAVRFEAPFSGRFDGMAAFCRSIAVPCPTCKEALTLGTLCRHGKPAFITMGTCENHGSFFVRFELSDNKIIVSAFVSDKTFEGIYAARLRHKEKREKYRRAYADENKKRKNQTGNNKKAQT